MKKLIKLISVLLVCCVLSACNTGGQINGGDNISAMGASKFLTGYSTWGITYEVTGCSLTISGVIESDLVKHIMATFNENDALTETTSVNNGFFSMSVDCTPFDNRTVINLYMNDEAYGTYEGLSDNEIILIRTGSGYEFEQSPVYNQNLQIFNAYKNPDDYLSPSYEIQSDDPEIIQLAESITRGINNDYDRIKAVHKWVCENIYYDYDALMTGNYENLDAKGMLIYRKGVCEGYSNLTAALLRSIDIPCRKQSGYGLGIGTSGSWDSYGINTNESNHTWNEAYAEGRWIILDTTWDSRNDYKNGEYLPGEHTTNKYFDSTMEYFSMTHKLIAE